MTSHSELCTGEDTKLLDQLVDAKRTAYMKSRVNESTIGVVSIYQTVTQINERELNGLKKAIALNKLTDEDKKALGL